MSCIYICGITAITSHNPDSQPRKQNNGILCSMRLPPCQHSTATHPDRLQKRSQPLTLALLFSTIEARHTHYSGSRGGESGALNQRTIHTQPGGSSVNTVC